jgi:hypothetical protein
MAQTLECSPRYVTALTPDGSALMSLWQDFYYHRRRATGDGDLKDPMSATCRIDRKSGDAKVAGLSSQGGPGRISNHLSACSGTK